MSTHHYLYQIACVAHTGDSDRQVGPSVTQRKYVDTNMHVPQKRAVGFNKQVHLYTQILCAHLQHWGVNIVIFDDQ